jgi:hypothetical protein
MAENNTEQQEWHLIYQVSVQDIAFFKGQQWLVTNYGLLLYAAVVGIASLLRSSLTEAERWVLTALVWAIAGSALYMVWSLDRAIGAARARLAAARDRFTDNVRNTLDAQKQARCTPRADVSVLLTIVLAVAGAIISWLLVCRLHAP